MAAIPPVDPALLDIPPDPDRRGVIGVVVREGRLLLIRRGPGVVAPGMYCFPGGGIEPGESEPEALVREFREELGVGVVPVRPIWKSVAPWQVRLSWWRAELAPDAVLAPNPAEVASVHWLAPAEIAELPNSLPSNFEFLDALRAGQIDLGPGLSPT
ncbi:MAG: NUDIX domain-containing protein [Pirellulales bacterium]|nr:NUDIX domain-containing protein [Pirellulales bacterium]